jgi:hypothetical protein
LVISTFFRIFTPKIDYMDKKLNLEKGKYYICQNTIAEKKAEKNKGYGNN